MNDLPVLLDEPIAYPRRSRAARSADGARSTRAERSRATASGAAAIPWPWWMGPARLVGRLRPAVLAAAAADAIVLRRLPRIAILLAPPIIVFVLAAIVSISHATATVPHPLPRIDWLRLTTDVVYTESALFLLLAIVVGTLSPALGVLLVGVFGIADIAAATRHEGDLRPMPQALVGRLIGIWLLWLLAVEIPAFGRQLGRSWQRLAGNRLAVAVLTGLATGAFVWIWTQAAIVLIRPVFTWSSLPSGVTVEAIRPVQTAGIVFAVAGGLLAAVMALLRGPSGLMVEAAVDRAPQGGGPIALVGGLVRRVLGAALLTVALGGLISVPLEAVVLFGVLLGAGPLAQIVADRTPLGQIVGSVTPFVRYIVAAALAFGVAQLTIAPLYRAAAFDSTGTVPEFFSVIAAVAIGFIVVELATTPGTRQRSPASVATLAAVVLLMVGILQLVALAAPVTALADNCAGLVDCWGTPFLAALTGGGLPLLFGMLTKKSPPKPPREPTGIWGPWKQPPPPPERSPEEKKRDRDFADKKKDYWTREANRQKSDPKFPNDRDMQRREDQYIQKQREYWSNPPPQTSDGYSISPQAVASSGAGTKG